MYIIWVNGVTKDWNDISPPYDVRGIFGAEVIDEQLRKEINTCPLAKSRAEEIYILKRRIKAFGSSLCFYLCRIFPIKKNLISVCTFEGKGGFGCNPKYIVQELHNRDSKYEFVWLVNRQVIEQKRFPNYIRVVPNTLWNRAYWLSRSKVWIDNYRKPFGTVKRKKQLYINTWHGMSGFKSIGLWRGKAFSKMAYLVSRSDSKMVDCFLSDSKFTDEFFPKGLVYEGEFLKIGAPRCDLLLKKREELRNKFCEKYNVNYEDKYVMFAPTYREIASDGKRSVHSQLWSIDFERVIQNLEKRFGGKWHLVLRLHPQLVVHYQENIGKNIDVSLEDDMNEVLGAMDVLITDYSSCAMDAAMMHIPVFVYADDIEKYKNDRGIFTWEIDEQSRRNICINKISSPNIDAILPFTIAKNNDELETDILEYDEKEYLRLVKDYEIDIGLLVSGDASEKVANYIIEQVG